MTLVWNNGMQFLAKAGVLESCMLSTQSCSCDAQRFTD